jgi:SAM-dependent methyltransferase
MKICGVLALVAGLVADVAARQDSTWMAYAEAAAVIEALRDDLRPEEMRGKALPQVEAVWPAWVARHDTAVRARVEEGDDDSVVHLLLFGSTFTERPRATDLELAGLVRDPAAALASLRPRIDDFLVALAAPGANDRLLFARQRMERRGFDLRTEIGRANTRAFLEDRTRRIGADAPSLRLLDGNAGVADTRTLFRDRGLSSDTTIFIDHGIDRALEALKDSRILPGDVRRVAIIGPGLDVIDKQRGYDFYPLQTIQPFAVVDSLLRFGLAEAGQLQVTAYDLSPRVHAHLTSAREAAQAGRGYTLVLPRDLDRPWTPGLVDYWERLGNFVSDPPSGSIRTPPAPLPVPPRGAGRVGLRSVVVAPSVVLSITPRDFNIVLQREGPATGEAAFDLVIATNVLLYYGVFEQSLAVTNIARMLRPGGILLTNNPVFELPESPMVAAGSTATTYMSLPGIGETGDRVVWYQRQE